MPTQTSVMRTQKSMVDDINYLYSNVKQIQSFDFFVPFIKERDGLGRLMTHSNEYSKPIRAKSSYSHYREDSRNHPKRKLITRKTIDVEVERNSPTIGSYHMPSN